MKFVVLFGKRLIVLNYIIKKIITQKKRETMYKIILMLKNGSTIYSFGRYKISNGILYLYNKTNCDEYKIKDIDRIEVSEIYD